MGTEREQDPTLPQKPRREEGDIESLTDLIDRMDRESFRRVLEQRELRFVAQNLQRRPT